MALNIRKAVKKHCITGELLDTTVIMVSKQVICIEYANDSEWELAGEIFTKADWSESLFATGDWWWKEV